MAVKPMSKWWVWERTTDRSMKKWLQAEREETWMILMSHSQLIELIAVSYTDERRWVVKKTKKDDLSLLIFLLSLQKVWWGEHAELHTVGWCERKCWQNKVETADKDGRRVLNSQNEETMILNSVDLVFKHETKITWNGLGLGEEWRPTLPKEGWLDCLLLNFWKPLASTYSSETANTTICIETWGLRW